MINEGLEKSPAGLEHLAGAKKMGKATKQIRRNTAFGFIRLYPRFLFQ